MNEKTPIKEVIELLKARINNNDVKDAVHKIKFMTTCDVLNELLRENPE